jgi:hypothetical protein
VQIFDERTVGFVVAQTGCQKRMVVKFHRPLRLAGNFGASNLGVIRPWLEAKAKRSSIKTRLGSTSARLLVNAPKTMSVASETTRSNAPQERDKSRPKVLAVRALRRNARGEVHHDVVESEPLSRLRLGGFPRAEST